MGDRSPLDGSICVWCGGDLEGFDAFKKRSLTEKIYAEEKKNARRLIVKGGGEAGRINQQLVGGPWRVMVIVTHPNKPITRTQMLIVLRLRNIIPML